MLRPILFLILLCSCVSQRQAEKYFDANPDKLAEYVEDNEAFREPYGKAYAGRNFPVRPYAPAIRPTPSVVPKRLHILHTLDILPVRRIEPGFIDCAACKPITVLKTIYREDTTLVNDLRTALKHEKSAHQNTRQHLQTTAAERDYWQEMNEKKFWTLIAMAVFALLYIIFKLLASRVREEGEV